MNKFITYEMFGAIGDGMHDDMPAIVRAHEEANRLNLPVRAKEGASYYISPLAMTAVIKTDVDWTGAKIIIDDRQCENLRQPCFSVESSEEEAELKISSIAYGQTILENPTGRDLHIVVKNANHADYIRKGLNQDNGHPRADTFILYADGTISSPVSFDFEEITELHARPIPEKKLTLRGGEFTTIANQYESRYSYHARNIEIRRSNVEICDIKHYVTGEIDHGAPYRGFISILDCALVHVHDCLFTAHFIYWTIGSAKLPVAMGSYDINIGFACNITFSRCTQTTDIMDEKYWGLMGTNFCRDLTFEDCVFSRFDAHMGVSNCTLRRCKLGWQCLNAIGHGTFLVEDTDAYGRSFVSLRADYGSTWRGEIILRNCIWHPLSRNTKAPVQMPRSIFSAHNPGNHFFGYDCYLPNVIVDGLTIAAETEFTEPLYVFNDYTRSFKSLELTDTQPEETPYPIIPPRSVRIRNIAVGKPVDLCSNPALMPDTEFIAE